MPDLNYSVLMGVSSIVAFNMALEYWLREQVGPLQHGKIFSQKTPRDSSRTSLFPSAKTVFLFIAGLSLVTLAVRSARKYTARVATKMREAAAWDPSVQLIPMGFLRFKSKPKETIDENKSFSPNRSSKASTLLCQKCSSIITPADIAAGTTFSGSVAPELEGENAEAPNERDVKNNDQEEEFVFTVHEPAEHYRTGRVRWSASRGFMEVASKAETEEESAAEGNSGEEERELPTQGWTLIDLDLEESKILSEATAATAAATALATSEASREEAKDNMVGNVLPDVEAPVTNENV